jgi:hypothetical protein
LFNLSQLGNEGLGRPTMDLPQIQVRGHVRRQNPHVFEELRSPVDEDSEPCKLDDVVPVPEYSKSEACVLRTSSRERMDMERELGRQSLKVNSDLRGSSNTRIWVLKRSFAC